jgi:hypothetical protein
LAGCRLNSVGARSRVTPPSKVNRARRSKMPQDFSRRHRTCVAFAVDEILSDFGAYPPRASRPVVIGMREPSGAGDATGEAKLAHNACTSIADL